MYEVATQGHTAASRAYNKRKVIIDALQESQRIEGAYYARVADLSTAYLDEQSKRLTSVLEEALPLLDDEDETHQRALTRFANVSGTGVAVVREWIDTMRTLATAVGAEQAAESAVSQARQTLKRHEGFFWGAKDGHEREHALANAAKLAADAELAEARRERAAAAEAAREVGSRVLSTSMANLSALVDARILGAAAQEAKSTLTAKLREAAEAFHKEQKVLIGAASAAAFDLYAMYEED